MNQKIERIFFVLFISLGLTSCSLKGSIGEIISVLPEDIIDFKTFFVAFIIIFILRVVLSLLLKIIGLELPFLVSIGLFIYVLITKDYGFFLTLLIFFGDVFLGLILSLLFSFFRGLGKN